MEKSTSIILNLDGDPIELSGPPGDDEALRHVGERLIPRSTEVDGRISTLAIEESAVALQGLHLRDVEVPRALQEN